MEANKGKEEDSSKAKIFKHVNALAISGYSVLHALEDIIMGLNCSKRLGVRKIFVMGKIMKHCSKDLEKWGSQFF